MTLGRRSARRASDVADESGGGGLRGVRANPYAATERGDLSIDDVNRDGISASPQVAADSMLHRIDKISDIMSVLLHDAPIED